MGQILSWFVSNEVHSREGITRGGAGERFRLVRGVQRASQWEWRGMMDSVNRMLPKQAEHGGTNVCLVHAV